MCNVTISINEAIVRRFNPSLSSLDAIQQWLQHQVNIMMENLADTKEPPCCYNSTAEVIAEAERRMEAIESGKAKLIPHEEVRQRMEKMIASYAD